MRPYVPSKTTPKRTWSPATATDDQNVGPGSVPDSRLLVPGPTRRLRRFAENEDRFPRCAGDEDMVVVQHGDGAAEFTVAQGDRMRRIRRVGKLLQKLSGLSVEQIDAPGVGRVLAVERSADEDVVPHGQQRRAESVVLSRFRIVERVQQVARHPVEQVGGSGVQIRSAPVGQRRPDENVRAHGGNRSAERVAFGQRGVRRIGRIREGMQQCSRFPVEQIRDSGATAVCVVRGRADKHVVTDRGDRCAEIIVDIRRRVLNGQQ